MRLIEISRAGRHVASDGSPVNFSARDLAEVADGYDPKLHEAPIVIGHPKDNGPAFGWVKALGTRGASLEAMASQLEPAFAEAVRSGRYKKVSASFYRPDAEANPTPGKWYLRHVGFLGAAAPAVKGLRAVELSDGSPKSVVEIEVAFAEGDPAAPAATASTLGGALTPLREWLSTTYGPDAAEMALPEATLAGEDEAAPFKALCAWLAERYGAAAPAAADGTTPAAPTADHREGAKRAAPSPDPRRAELDRREAAIAKRERDVRRAEHASFLEGLVRDGRPLPAPREDVLGLLDVLSTVPRSKDIAASFAEGEVRTPEEICRDMLKRMPKQIDFSERSPATRHQVAGDDPTEVARAAQAHQADQAAKGIHVSTAEAVRAVKGGR